MKNNEYWAKRFGVLESSMNAVSQSTYAGIEPVFEQAQKEIQNKIDVWVARVAKNNELSMSDAKKLLNTKELAEFKWDVKDYIQYGKTNALDASWVKELENASAKVHVSKLEALKISTQQSIEKAFGNELDAVDEMAKKVFTDDYYHSCYEIQKGYNIGWNIGQIDDNKLQKIISKPWTADGSNFSDRIWQSKTTMVSDLHSELTRTCLLGKAPDEAIKNMTKYVDGKFKNAKSQAGRLVMTEQAFFASAAQKEAFNDLDVEEFEIVATLDSSTSEICRAMDGQHFPMNEFKAGTTAPPFHPWCRSCTCPFFDDEWADGHRAARDEENDETYYVPSDMKYPDWKSKFVDGGDISDMGVYDVEGMVHYSKVIPEVPKKEYLTKKKLQANIANADVEIEGLQEEFAAATGDITHDEILNAFGSLDKFAAGDDLVKLKAIQKQIEQLELDKSSWQVKLDEKLLKEQKKLLTKQKVKLQEQVDNFEVKSYSGIWKDEVTTADWSKLNIEGKKKYYEGKFINESDPDLLKQYQEMYRQLQELDDEGKALYELQSDLKKTTTDLTNLNKSSTIKDTNDAFSQERKDAAYWFDSGFSAADDYFDPPSKLIHDAATPEEFDGFYTYTSGSGGHNRPLAGFQKAFYDDTYGSKGWEEGYYKGAKNVWIDYEGKGDQIRGLTTLIEKSTYDADVWLQSGQDFQTLEGFLNIKYGSLSKMSDAQLQEFVGKRNTFYQFMSTAVNEGGGSMFNRKPMKLNIYAPKGSQMLYASKYGAFGKGENEMILQRGGTYDIKKIYWGTDATDGNRKKIFVDMELRVELGYDTFQQDPSEWAGSTKNYRS